MSGLLFWRDGALRADRISARPVRTGAAIAMADATRETAAEAIRSLKELSVRPVTLSHDSRATAQRTDAGATREPIAPQRAHCAVSPRASIVTGRARTGGWSVERAGSPASKKSQRARQCSPQ
jgi:hypothetical protein